MGQLKFEKDFSEQLREREIEPKSGSWEELSARMNANEKGKKPVYWWIGIAASLVGGILIISLLFHKSISETPGIVRAPAEEILREAMEPRQISQQNPASEEVSAPEKASGQPVETVFSKKEPLAGSTLASVGSAKESPNKENDQAQRDPELIVETKISEIPEEWIAEASSKEEKKGNVSDTEVDALLAEAMTKISAERKAKYVSEIIDPKGLLLDAQLELELSFRDKVFDVLREGYFKAKTAVVNRN